MDQSGWRFKHVGLIVRDTDKAYEFFKGMGFEVSRERFFASPAIPNPPKSHITHLNKGGLVLEIIQPMAGKFINMEFLETVGEGVNHICFEVDDLASEKKKMAAQGFAELYGSEVFGYFDTRAHGNMIIELDQKRDR